MIRDVTAWLLRGVLSPCTPYLLLYLYGLTLADLIKVIDIDYYNQYIVITSMFGKLFESLFTGSMVGAGAPVFAVWAYVVANQKPDRNVGAQVELNPKLLSFVIGEPEESIRAAIDFLCSADPNSRTPNKDGRRLVKLGTFDYQVVNGAKYMAIRDEEKRRQQNRTAQRTFRAKLSKTPAEKQFEETGQMPDERPVNGEPPLQWDNEADS